LPTLAVLFNQEVKADMVEVWIKRG
jgi:hypothetical protein